MTDLEVDDEGVVNALFKVDGTDETGDVYRGALDAVRQKIYQRCISRAGFKSSDVPRMLQWEQLGQGNLSLDFEGVERVARFYASHKDR